MKRYIKDGIIKSRNNIVLRVTKEINGKEVKLQIINPSEEAILADGWVEYIVPEPTEEEKLERAKATMKHRLKDYDSSQSVNQFSIGETSVWLDKATRAGLMLRFQAEIATGKENTVLWYGNQQFPLPLSEAMQMLYALELYASECYDNTQSHYAAIDALTTVEDVEAYDFTVGYPEKLRF